MGKEVETRVIKPPVERIVSGRVFKPDKAYLYKTWVKNIAIAAIIWLGVMVTVVGFVYFVNLVDPGEMDTAISTMGAWTRTLSNWLIIGNLIWLIPAQLLTYIYIKSIEYSVISESGESMPEIYSRRGILTVTRKHLPFRAITNISSKAGVFDRLFGLGNVHVETAGYSGTSQTSPEEKLEGIRFYEEVRDFILKELRKFRAPYVTTTEPIGVDVSVPKGSDLSNEILVTLQEIRDLLKQTGEE